MDKASDFYVYGHPKIAGSSPATIKVYPRGYSQKYVQTNGEFEVSITIIVWET